MMHLANRVVAAITATAILAAPLTAFAEDQQEAPLPPAPLPVVVVAPAPAPLPPPQAAQPTYVMVYGGPRVITDYEEGDRIPSGYHKEDRMRTGLFAAGAGVFGGMYLLTAFVGWAGEVPLLCAPVVGPFILAAGAHDSDASVAGILIFDGLVQAAGLAMLIGGISSTRTVLVRDKMTTLTVTPMVGRATGAMVMGTF
ncbi:MAG TPA: hypothetical protein VF316_11810 [Polyangiaceae bacterium]